MSESTEQVGIANPFFHRGPIRNPEYFINRESEISIALELLRNLQNVAIVGPRRLGKSSLMFHLARPTVQTDFGWQSDQYLFVYLDGEELLNIDAAKIRELMTEELILELKKAGLDTSHISNAKKANEVEGLEYRSFRRILRETTSDKLKLIFCLDEFDCLAANPYLNQSFFSSLRALASQFELAFITASKDEIQQLTYANNEILSSPFFNTFATIHLGLFTEKDSRNLIEKLAALESVKLPSELIERILKIAGPHPLFLQIAAFHAFNQWRNRRTQLTAEDWELVERRFTSEVKPHFEYYWHQLTEDERYVIAILPQIESGIGYTQILYRLERRCLICRLNERWRYLSSSFEAFIRLQEVTDLLQTGTMVLDLRRREAFWHQSRVSLTKTEFDAMVYFVCRPNQIISAKELEEALWPGEYIEDPERVRSLIKSLRKSLGNAADCLETVWGVGFRYNNTI